MIAGYLICLRKQMACKAKPLRFRSYGYAIDQQCIRLMLNHQNTTGTSPLGFENPHQFRLDA